MSKNADTLSLCQIAGQIQVMNSHVQAEINLFTRGERNFFRSSYKRSGRYRPQIVAALREAGLQKAREQLPPVAALFDFSVFRQLLLGAAGKTTPS